MGETREKVQRKSILRVGAHDDLEEVEADRVAAAVTDGLLGAARSSSGPGHGGQPGRVQRAASRDVVRRYGDPPSGGAMYSTDIGTPYLTADADNFYDPASKYLTDDSGYPYQVVGSKVYAYSSDIPGGQMYSSQMASPQYVGDEEHEYDDPSSGPMEIEDTGGLISDALRSGDLNVENVKYAHHLSIGDDYKGEDKDGSHHLPDIFAMGEKRVAEGKVGSLGEFMKTFFGWGDDDVERYVTNGEKSVVAYLDENERETFQLHAGAPMLQGPDRQIFDTGEMFSKHSGKGFGVYVMSKGGDLYANQHKVGLFHHSSFLAGGDVAGAGEIEVTAGRVKTVTNKTGHYRAGQAELWQVLEELRSRGVSLGGVTVKTYDDPSGSSAAGFHSSYEPDYWQPEVEDDEPFDLGSGSEYSSTIPQTGAGEYSSTIPQTGAGQYSSTIPGTAEHEALYSGPPVQGLMQASTGYVNVNPGDGPMDLVEDLAYADNDQTNDLLYAMSSGGPSFLYGIAQDMILNYGSASPTYDAPPVSVKKDPELPDMFTRAREAVAAGQFSTIGQAVLHFLKS